MKSLRCALVERGLALAVGFAVFGLPGSANAQITEPDKITKVPKAPLPEETGKECATGSLTLPGLFKFYKENIDWQKDAQIAPAAFSPRCGFSATLVMRSGGCTLDFGWYNAEASGGAQPKDSEIYTIIPWDDPQTYLTDVPTGRPYPPCTYHTNQQTKDFWPQAYAITPPNPKLEPRKFDSASILSDPRYKGGLIGFALRGNNKGPGICTQTHFSQAELNDQCTSCSPKAPWIVTLVYKSTATPDAYYLAFEDLPTSPTQFDPLQTAAAGWTARNDGDFNDFVFFVTGVSCAGGGEACEVPGQQGACAAGRTDCVTGGTATCRQVVSGSPEKCDNIDNDCNGKVDDGNLCDPGLVCDRGTCVPACDSGEFQCSGALVCDNGFCIEPACKGVTCQPSQVCREGKCVGGCEGVVCPQGQECQLGRCIDPCVGVTCDATKVCEKGVCVANCQCKSCGDGNACHANGSCVEKGCETQTCDAGKICKGGTCADACEGVVCPGGAACENGQCGEGNAGSGGTSTGAGGTGVIGPVGTGGSISIPGSGGSTSSGGTATGSGGTKSSSTPRKTEDAGCACRLVGPQRASHAALLLAALGLVAGVARRQRKNRKS
jgi:MYXO-CTERM domain-containing protein